MKVSLSITALAVSVLLSAAEIAAPWNGKTEVPGNGKFCFRKAVLSLEPGKSYRFDYRMSKVPPMSAKKIENRLVLFSVSDGKFSEIMTSGEEVPADGKVHQVATAFTVPANAKGEILLFAYNCNASGVMKISDFKVSQLSDTEKFKAGTVIAPVQTAGENVGKSSPNEIRPKLGNSEQALLEGNGRFLFRQEELPMKAGDAYTAEMQVCKRGKLSANPAEHRLVLAVTTTSGKFREFCYAAENVPSDGKWHTVSFHCTVPADSRKVMLYLYNCNASGNMEMKNLVFQRQTALAFWGPEKIFSLPGNGKFLGKHYTVAAQAGKNYDIAFKIRKSAGMSANSAEHRVVLSCVTAAGKIYEFAYLGEKAAPDNTWHDVKQTVLVPKDCGGTIRISVYNCNSNGKLDLSDFSMESK